MGNVGKKAPPRKLYICKHCKTRVISKTNVRAAFGFEHGKHCPRRNRM